MFQTIHLKHLMLLFCSLFLLTLTSCDDDDEVTPEYTIDDFVGSWKATSLTHTNNADPNQKVDIVAIGGEVRFTMLEGGRVRTWVEIDTFYDEWDALVRIEGDQLISTPEESSRGVQTYTWEYDGTTLRMTDTDDTFPFEPGVETSTTAVGVFERN